MSQESPLPAAEPSGKIRVAAALRGAIASGYNASTLRADLLAGVVVGVVALPLSMALAVAVGVPPQHGLYTAIVAGFVIAVLGGSKVQVSGPTAAFVVILAPIVVRHGLGGLLLATMLAGLLQACLALARAGRLIQLVPYPVTVGFTAGIAVVIATLQVQDLLGLAVAGRPEHYLDRVEALARALPTARWPEFATGLSTLLMLVLWPRVSRRIPAPLVALAVAALVAWALEQLVPGFHVATIRDRFAFETADGIGLGIPRLAPQLVMPWNLAGADGAPIGITFDLVRELLPSAFAIAMLGAIESLLSAVVADGMMGDNHDPDAELFAQGVGNVLCPLFGGIAATGAIARTATNVRAGGRTPIAAVVHSLVVLSAVLAFAPVLGYLPMASLAALLTLVAWNMAEVRHVAMVLRTSPRGDSLVLLTCLGLTVLFDMVIAVGAGLVLASILFMRRMIEVSEVRLVDEQQAVPPELRSKGIVWYEIAGPLFFGAAHRATSALHRARSDAKVVVLDLSAVPVIDATGLVNLRSAISRLHRDGLVVVLAGMGSGVKRVLRRAGVVEEAGKLLLCDSTAEAVDRASAAAESMAAE
ncbi:C4-dicarboxylic acid transporter DauA [Engelhardtia mirabilis]|uniref:C4-dicarboxylic acid transporter DauA n=1 Tax=Engelhardtia mirabilis TaxID=2528011 RepID=A0A518BP08_9BACT|nr:C4-dicarboxylic acid transporter DauA [Planctomycetes bacterium Pla133]QDV03013.1 C4-dicarboxylic acid transporter DauA [Planctomycetes bacterium Pla86]